MELKTGQEGFCETTENKLSGVDCATGVAVQWSPNSNLSSQTAATAVIVGT